MGVLIKFLLILILAIYTFYKVAGFLFRIVFGNLKSDPGGFRQSRQSTKKAPDSNLNIDKVPHPETGSKPGYQGGEYVDFEEVK